MRAWRTARPTPHGAAALHAEGRGWFLNAYYWRLSVWDVAWSFYGVPWLRWADALLTCDLGIKYTQARGGLRLRRLRKR